MYKFAVCKSSLRRNSPDVVTYMKQARMTLTLATSLLMILSPWFQRVLSLNMDGVADYVKEGLDLYMTGCLKTQDSSLCFQLALLPSEPYFLLSGQHKDRSILWNPRHYFFFMFIYMWEFLRNHTSNQMKILLSCTPCWEVSKHTLHNKAVKSVDKYLPTLPNYLYADLTLTFLY